jgi:glyoxylase-like metal-dependent hydrolase (beta-lactamase superfamily II)
MRKSSLFLFAIAVVLSAGAWMARTQAPQAPAQLTLEKVKNNLYVIIGDGGNVAVYVTDDGVILVDDKFERDAADIMAKVKSVTDKPVKYVLNTHQHGDHTGGNQKLLDASAEIISQKNARANMVATKMPGAPRVSFTDETEVFLGGHEVRAHYYGRGHTNGDAMIYFPELKVIHTGDLFTNGAPFIDYSASASAVEWPKTIDNVLKSDWDFDIVIPGHGPVSKRADLIKYRDKFVAMNDRVSGMLRGGKNKDEVKAVLVSDFGWQATGLGANSIDGLIAELKK